MASPITPLYRLLFLAVLSAALMLVDHNSRLLAGARAIAGVISLPLHAVIGAPGAAGAWWAARQNADDLQRKYAKLLAKQAVLEARLQRFDALQAENRRLSELLAAPRRPGERVQLAELVDLGLTPFGHRVGLNRGLEAGVHLGQAVIEITADNTAEFLSVTAAPFADIRFAEHVLLLSVDTPGAGNATVTAPAQQTAGVTVEETAGVTGLDATVTDGETTGDTVTDDSTVTDADTVTDDATVTAPAQQNAGVTGLGDTVPAQ